MKYGQQLEEASVPEWSLHNIDYNALKWQIKTQTTKDQATALTIPGQQDYALQRFEDAFYLELCHQHDRVHLFVISKADEISRRLRHLSGLVHQLMLRCNDAGRVSMKRQRRFAKYQFQVNECRDDIRALRRFVNAQVVAFRKILKKYKKWTGSTTLSARFKENVLSSPKSFTKRDFHPLELQYQELTTTLRAACPDTTPDLLQPDYHDTIPRPPSRRERSRQSSQTAVSESATPMAYWNEYDYGSEAGDHADDDSYAIFIDPTASVDFPGLVYIKTMFNTPVDKVRHWLKARSPKHVGSETQALLDNNGSQPVDYFTVRQLAAAATTDNDATEDEYASSEDLPLGHIDDHKMSLYRDMVLTRSVVLTFLAAFVLLIISGVLIMTGRHKLRLEVDAGVTVGSVASLFCACMGLGAMLYRQYSASYMYSLAVWAAFLAVCALNGMLLVLVVGRSGL